MTTFAFVVREMQGAEREGRIEADSRDAATKALRQQGLQIVELDEVNNGGSWFARRISRADIVYFTSQLAMMVETGIGLATALGGLCEQCDHPGMRELLQSLKRKVESGQDFSAALAEHPRNFDRTYVALIKASERTGSLGVMLDQLANHLNKDLENRRKVRAAMAYPAIMLLLAVGVTIFLLTYVMPKFSPLFQREGIQLPTPTVVMLAVSSALIDYWWAWVAGFGAAAVGYWRAQQTPAGRQAIDGVRIHMPIFGPVLRKVILSRAMHTLGLMVRSGVSMLDSIKLCAEVSGNYYYERLWLHVLEEITKGNRICEALRGHPLVPKTLVQMIGSGEETGKLDLVLNKVSMHYDQEVEAAIKTSTSLIEPIMISVMGVVVGGIGMGLMLPIFTLSRSAGH